jgi:hypothetical protein
VTRVVQEPLAANETLYRAVAFHVIARSSLSLQGFDATLPPNSPFIRTEIGTLEQRSGRSICRVVGRNVDQSAKRQMTLGDPLLNK